MIKKLTDVLVKMVKKYLPNPFVFALILTAIVFFLGIFYTDFGPVEMLDFWYNGYFSLLKFTMQMVFILITGYALAKSPVVGNMLKKLALIPKTPVQAIMFTCAVSYACGYLNWGFGLIAGALIAKEIAVQNSGKGIHYPILIAAAYSGNIVRGPSTSIPLAIATKGHFLEDVIGIVPVSQTLYSSWNIVITLTLFVSIPLLYRVMAPKYGEAVIEVDFEKIKEPEVKLFSKEILDTPASKLNNSSFLTLIISIPGLMYIIMYFLKNGLKLNLNIVIFIFLILGLLAHKTPINYVNSINDAIKTCGGIALLFPFYAGIMGIMKSSGLAVMMSNMFVSISTAQTFPLYTFWSAGLVNLFVPSGGGQWAVQGPIMIPAAVKVGANVSKVAMALAWGDSWTNQIQPFWALPILAIAGLDVKDIMGYCLMVAILAGTVISGLLVFL
ncbi:TIGR00366 family protein [uncultured Ilyobacter sp.]|uniref:short-chain fatty acid transporter n=1 Tax=uncultured Ilyobacter sp. TaxID=544433 RepID=UPI0029F486E6|nr:TIGR00366 family protein [uncultured Ilyobacter sp.]